MRRCRGARLGCRRRLTLEKAPLPKPQFNQDGTPLEYARLNESSYYDAVKSIDHRDDDVTNTNESGKGEPDERHERPPDKGNDEAAERVP